MPSNSFSLHALSLLALAVLAFGACADPAPGTPGPTGGTDECLTACDGLAQCPEFADVCPGDVLLTIKTSCIEACKDDTQRTQVLAANELGCTNAVPALVDALELSCNNGNNGTGGGSTTGGGTTGTTGGGTTGNGTTGTTGSGTTGSTTGGGTTGPGEPCGGDCPEGLACNTNNNQCEPDNACLGVTCTNGQICDIQTGQCRDFSCQPDTLEPNDAANTARSVPFEDATLSGLSICSGDTDWYAITVPAGQSVIFNFFFQVSLGDLDARAFESDGTTTVSRSETSDDNERIAIPASDITKNYLVRIAGFNNAENSYTLEIATNPGDGGACNTQSDCPDGQICNTDLRFCYEEPPCRTDGDCPGALRCDPNDGACYSCVTDDHCPGAYCFQNQCNECRLNEHCDGGGVCSDGFCQFLFCEEDPNEPNNIRGDATPLTPGRYGGLALCDNDEDFFAINVPANVTIYLAAEFEYAQGDIDIDILRADGTFENSSRDFEDNEYLAVRNLPPGQYFVRLFFSQFQAEGSQCPYSLTYDIDPEGLCFNDGDCPSGRECARDYFCANQSCDRHTDCRDAETPRCDDATNTCQPCEDDSLEPNPESAPRNLTNLAPGERLNTCNGDDYYTFSAATGQQITITVSHVYREGDIDVYLLDNNDNNLTFATSGNDEEVLNWTAEYSGIYKLWVDAYQDVYNTYNLDISVQ